MIRERSRPAEDLERGHVREQLVLDRDRHRLVLTHEVAVELNVPSHVQSCSSIHM